MNISKSFSFIVFLIGLIVIVGWVLDIEIIKRIHPNFAAMNPTTAASFILLGLSLFLSNLNPRYKYISIGLSLVVFLIGALKLLEVVFGFPIAVDQVLFKEKLPGGLDTVPNRMSPNAAINFTLMGLSLILINLHRFSKIALIMTSISVAIATLAIIGYTYNFVSLYGFSTFTPMAVHTAASFLLLSFGIFSTPQIQASIKSYFIVEKINGLTIRTRLLSSFGLLIFFLVLFTIITFINIELIQNTLIPVRTNIRAARVAVLELRRYEKDFLSRDVTGNSLSNLFESGTSENVKQWEGQYQVFLDNVAALEKFYQARNDASRVGEINKLRSVSKEYHDYFIHLKDVYLERGFKDYGLEGEMRVSIRSLESDLTDPSLLVLLLQARRSEKDFFLRNDPEELDRFYSSTIELGKKLKGKQLDELNNYVDTFNKIVKFETEIGLKIDEGIIGRMRHAINKLEPTLALEEEYVLSLTNQNIGIIERLIASLALVFTISSILLAYYISKIIARNVSRLDEERAKIKTMLGSIGDGVFAVDNEEKIILFNMAASQISGYSLEEALGKPYKEILKFISEKDGLVSEQFVKTAQSGAKAEMLNHTLLVKKDGRKVPVADSAAPILNNYNKVDGVVVVFRDVTREKEIDKAKSEFVSLASHELKTPLGIMKWYMEAIKDDKAFNTLPDQIKEYLEDIYGSNERVLGLVKNLLDVTRIDEGRVKDAPKSTDVVKVIQERIAELKPILDKKSILLSMDIQDKSMPSIIIDPLRFSEVIDNIISNAIKYNKEKGQIKVTISRESDFIKIIVADTGFGVPATDLPKIFNKFYRASNALKSLTDGTGLGLYVVKSYLESWGGDISINSKEGEGTAVSMRVPLRPKS